MFIQNRARAVLLGLALTRGVAAGAQVSLPEWKLSAAPQVTIGGDGSPRTEFQWINGAWRLPGEGIAIVNGATSEVRVFDARGAFLHSFGRKGQGPGEFERIGWSGHFADTAVIYDPSLRRITTILLRGTPQRIAEQSVTVNDEHDAGVAGRLADGRWLMRGYGRPDVNVRGLSRMPGYVGVVGSSATGKVRWLVEMPDFSIHISPPRSDGFDITPSAFPAGMVAAASGQMIWVGDGATDTLIRIDPSTDARKTIRLPAGEPLTKAIVDRARSGEIDPARGQRGRDAVELKYSEKLLPRRLPTFEAFVAGTRGELWVHRGTAFRSMPAEYLVFGPNGVPIARVTTAPGFRVTDVGPGYVVGVHRDDDGAETVRLYALRRENAVPSGRETD